MVTLLLLEHPSGIPQCGHLCHIWKYSLLTKGVTIHRMVCLSNQVFSLRSRKHTKEWATHLGLVDACSCSRGRGSRRTGGSRSPPISHGPSPWGTRLCPEGGKPGPVGKRGCRCKQCARGIQVYGDWLLLRPRERSESTVKVLVKWPDTYLV